MEQANDIAMLARGRSASGSVELHQSVGSRIAEISPFIDRLMGLIEPLIRDRGEDPGPELAVEIAVQEAVANAVIHGNRLDPGKRVHVSCHCTVDGDVSISVRDEGRGFDPQTVPDPTDPNNLLRTHGRGIRLIRALMDEVVFENDGTILRMKKRGRARPPEM